MLNEPGVVDGGLQRGNDKKYQSGDVHEMNDMNSNNNNSAQKY